MAASHEDLSELTDDELLKRLDEVSDVARASVAARKAAAALDDAKEKPFITLRPNADYRQASEASGASAPTATSAGEAPDGIEPDIQQTEGTSTKTTS